VVLVGTGWYWFGTGNGTGKKMSIHKVFSLMVLVVLVFFYILHVEIKK